MCPNRLEGCQQRTAVLSMLLGIMAQGLDGTVITMAKH